MWHFSPPPVCASPVEIVYISHFYFEKRIGYARTEKGASVFFYESAASAELMRALRERAPNRCIFAEATVRHTPRGLKATRLTMRHFGFFDAHPVAYMGAREAH